MEQNQLTRDLYAAGYPKTVESGAGNSLDLLVHAVRWRIKIIPMVR